jgi:hypothetical protein
MTEYFLFFDGRYLVKVIDHGTAFRFTDGKWDRCDSFASKVSGMGGDADFESVTLAEVRKRFPTAVD